MEALYSLAHRLSGFWRYTEKISSKKSREELSQMFAHTLALHSYNFDSGDPQCVSIQSKSNQVMVLDTCHPNTQEVEVGGSQVGEQSEPPKHNLN